MTATYYFREACAWLAYFRCGSVRAGRFTVYATDQMTAEENARSLLSDGETLVVVVPAF